MRYWIVFILFGILLGCEEPIDINPPKGKPRLIVNGIISDDHPPYTVMLTWSTDYSFEYNDTVIYETGAQVKILDDAGNEEILTEQSPGIYLSGSSGMTGHPGRAYSLEIETSDGRQYASRPTVMPRHVYLDNIYYFRNYEWVNENGAYGLAIYLDWQEPEDQTNYYLRSFSYYWNNTWHDDVFWSSIFSDKYMNGYRFVMERISNHLAGKDFIVKFQQYNINKEAYDFWMAIRYQTDWVGDPWDVPPSPLMGNVYNINDEKDYALGYFQVSSVTTVQLRITE